MRFEQVKNLIFQIDQQHPHPHWQYFQYWWEKQEANSSLLSQIGCVIEVHINFSVLSKNFVTELLDAHHGSVFESHDVIIWININPSFKWRYSTPLYLFFSIKKEFIHFVSLNKAIGSVFVELQKQIHLSKYSKETFWVFPLTRLR